MALAIDGTDLESEDWEGDSVRGDGRNGEDEEEEEDGYAADVVGNFDANGGAGRGEVV